MNRRFFSIAIVSSCLAAAVHAKKDDEKVPDAKLSDCQIGEIISGNKVTIEGMAGKVVAIELWGRN